MVRCMFTDDVFFIHPYFLSRMHMVGGCLRNQELLLIFDTLSPEAAVVIRRIPCQADFAKNSKVSDLLQKRRRE